MLCLFIKTSCSETQQQQSISFLSAGKVIEMGLYDCQVAKRRASVGSILLFGGSEADHQVGIIFSIVYQIF